jgi:hypothetical protein
MIASADYASTYTSIASSASFRVGPVGTVCPNVNSVCTAATTAVSDATHLPPTDGMAISKVAFSSCFKPSQQINNALWQHVRTIFGSGSVWNWLGDNMYDDSTSMETKRIAYNAAREDPYYSALGPLAEPKIPTTGTWDDHDYAYNNDGR